jgi:hypothetical protein
MLGVLPGILVAATLALYLSAPAAAQTNTGNVYGSLFDEQGMPISGGTVTLMGAAASRTVKADLNGFFRFLRISPGKYSVTVAMPGFATVTRENVVVEVGQNTQLDVQMRPATVQENVTVTNATQLIDSRKVETGQTFTGEELTQIPTARDVWSLVQQIPGVQLDTVDVAGNASANIGGPNLTSKGSGNVAYEVDGATVTWGGTTWDPWTGTSYSNPFARQNGGTSMYFDFSTLENVEVATGGSILEQQNSGVTINVVTKRGTNQLKGSARFLYASANWQSSNTPQEAINAGLQTNSTRYIREYGGELGGPIIQNRLWLWAAGSRKDISLNPGTYIPDDVDFPQTTILEPWSAKLNAQISNANSAALYYQKSNRLEYGVGGQDPNFPPETRTNNLIPTSFYKVEDSNVFSPDLFGSIFASYQNTSSSSIPIGGLDKDLQWYDQSFHNTFIYANSTESQKQANLQTSKFFNTGRINHELRFGFSYRQQIGDSTSGLPGSQNAGGDETWPGGPIAQITRGVHRIFERQYWSAALGDTLTAGSLTVAAGLRYDLQQAKSLPGESFVNTMFANPCTDCGADGGSFPGLPGVKGLGAKDWQVQYTNWQPRVSATYALGEKKSTLLRASYARFADQMGYLAYWASTTPVVTGYYYYWNDLNEDHNVQPNEVLFNEGVKGFSDGVDPASIRSDQVPPSFRGLKTPTTNELTAGFDHQFTDNFAVSGTFSYRSTANLQQHLPTGASLSSYEFLGRAQGTATANGFAITFDEPFYGYTGASPSTTLTNRPGATQEYLGVDVSLVKRLSRNWMVQGNIGWNSFRQYLTTQSIQNPNNLFEPWEDGIGPNDNGGLANGLINASWQFNVNGLYQGPWGLSFGFNFFGRQGYPAAYFVSTSTQDLYFSQNILIAKADTYRYANVYQLDFRLQETFQIGPVTVVPAVELFNVTNENTILSRNQSVGWYNRAEATPFSQDPYFNQITQIQSPRIVRLGLQVNF